jgi:hypothetical protein
MLAPLWDGNVNLIDVDLVHADMIIISQDSVLIGPSLFWRRHYSNEYPTRSFGIVPGCLAQEGSGAPLGLNHTSVRLDQSRGARPCSPVTTIS